jgi:UDP-glucose 4-epimerase
MCTWSTSRAGHLAALDALVKRDASFVVNLGADLGYSVLDVVQSFEQTSGRPGAV